jgi:hypothetical protein
MSSTVLVRRLARVAAFALATGLPVLLDVEVTGAGSRKTNGGQEKLK